MNLKVSLSAILLALLMIGCGHDAGSLQQSKADGLNRKSFLNRYKDPVSALQSGLEALDYIDDSLSGYADGRLRAWNNVAFACYMLSDHEAAFSYTDSVLAYEGDAQNKAIEQVIADLLQARLLQRGCNIAESYKILYNIEGSRALERNKQSYLYPYAQLEYFITSLTLNYNYRHGREADVSDQIAQIETYKGTLPCDYAEDMAMNYALAYGYSRLCGEDDTLGRNLTASLSYCNENLKILSARGQDCPFQLANTIQMMAFLGEDENIPHENWERNDSLWYELCSRLDQYWGFKLIEEEDLVRALFERSADIFLQLDDPYQRLGACMATGRYLLKTGDTAAARQYFAWPLGDTLMPIDFAPKFEAMLYNGLIMSQAEGSQEDYLFWYQEELRLCDLIAQNEKADFLLQTQLDRSLLANKTSLAFIIILIVILIVVAVLAILLRQNQRKLEQETLRLQEAKQQDVERIANVETCLSVLRHDVTPFVNYLQNKKLPEEIRNEVLEQLLRTFDNIKNWTNLSIPTGLQFRGERFGLQEVFETVQAELPAPSYQPTACRVHGDRLLLHILLRNLVQNALHHSGGQVDVSAREEADFVHVEVRDNGCGMTDDQVESLFRADRINNDSSEHSGFGLILCRYIIKKHDDNTRRGCRIWAESQPGQGTTMHFVVAKDTP